MSHMIIEGIDTVYTPNTNKWKSTWHGLETVTEETEIAADGSNIPNVFNPIIEVPMNPQFPEDFAMDADTKSEIDNWKVICADCRNGLSGKIHPLHVPRSSYAIHDNRLLFDCMVGSANQVLGKNDYNLVTVGTLGGYSQFFMSIAIKGQDSFTVGNGDQWNKFFNLITSHNGLVASSFMLSMIRMVCMNTVMASINQADANGTKQNLRHSKESVAEITPELFEETLRNWIESAEQYQKNLSALKNDSMNLDSFRAFSAGVFTEEKSDKISTTSFNRVTELESLFVRGKGNSGESRYDALNAWTEYFTSGNGAGKQSGAKKIARANFGRGNDWKNEAFRVLTDQDEFNSAMERGERLLHDRALLAKAN